MHKSKESIDQQQAAILGYDDNSKNNMYHFINKTWNPLAGKCPHNCSYCYVNKMSFRPGIKNKYSGDIRLCDIAMKKNLGENNNYFVCSMNDLFADGVPVDYALSILNKCHQHNNSYFFQTKNTENMYSFYIGDMFPKNSILCTTIESNYYYDNFMGNAPNILNRVYWFARIKNMTKHITIEPIFNFHLKSLVLDIIACNPSQVNIGADSGRNNLPEPNKDKVLALIAELEKITKVNIKKNLKRLII
jgi:protein gp37